ncbi:hypothetical protein ACGTJS_02995 [Faucicola mancuniensis]|uniref:hypothetical protein n=1 Tax=Faucicola mancuniensis TaxID=1309795 RepID=UPI003977DB03
MLKHIAVASTLAIALTACSKTDKPAETPDLSSAPAPTASVSAPTTASVSAPTASTSLATTTDNAVGQANAKPAENVALKADLGVLLKTINDIDKKHQSKQAELEKQMQSATTPTEQKKVFDEILKQLDTQKTTLQALKFNEPRVTKVRDKMLENIADTRSAMAIMAKNPEATPQTNPDIGKSMQKAEKTALEVREMLHKLVEEAGIEPNANK